MTKLRYFKATNRGDDRNDTMIAVILITECDKKNSECCSRPSNCNGKIYSCSHKYLDNKWVKLICGESPSPSGVGYHRYCGQNLEELKEEDVKLITLL